MQVEKTLIISVLFLFYVFLFQDLVTAINALNPAIPLYPILHLVPYLIGTVIISALAYFGMSDKT